MHTEQCTKAVNKLLKCLNNWSISKKLNVIGLLLGIIGVIIIFSYGPPQPNFDPHRYLSDDYLNQEILDEKAEYDCLSKVGLGFIALGFGCQLIGTTKSKD